MAVTYASNALSMTIPFAGAELAVVFSYREFRRKGLGQAITGWALAVSAIMSTSALAVVLIAGAIAGGRSVATVAGSPARCSSCCPPPPCCSRCATGRCARP